MEGNVAVIHHELRTEWCKSTYLTMLQRLEQIREYLGQQGVEHICAVYPADKKELHKFAEMLGFKTVLEQSGHVVMELED